MEINFLSEIKLLKLLYLLIIFIISINIIPAYADNIHPYIKELNNDFPNQYYFKIINSKNPKNFFKKYHNILEENIDTINNPVFSKYLLNIINNSEHPTQFLLKEIPFCRPKTYFLLSAFELLKGRIDDSSKLFENGRKMLLLSGYEYNLLSSDFFLSMKKNTNSMIIYRYAFLLNPNPLIYLSGSIDNLFKYRFSTSLKLFLLFISNAINIKYIGIILLFFLLIFLSFFLSFSSFLYVKIFRWLKFIFHESLESGESIFFIPADSFINGRDNFLKKIIYILTIIIISISFLILLFSTGNNKLIKNSIFISDLYKYNISKDFNIEKILLKFEVYSETYDYIMGRREFLKNNLKISKKYFKKISFSSPFYNSAKYYLALIDYRNGKYEESIEKFYYLAYFEDCAEALIGLNMNYESLNDKKKLKSIRLKIKNNSKLNKLFNKWNNMSKEFGNNYKFPLFIDETKLIDFNLYFNNIFSLIILIFSFSLTIISLLMIYFLFSDRISILKLKICKDCGKISCENCRTTIEFCPYCFSLLPNNIDENFLNNHVIKTRGNSTFFLNFIFFGFTQYLTKLLIPLNFIFSSFLYLLICLYIFLIPIFTKNYSHTINSIFYNLNQKLLFFFIILYFSQLIISYIALKIYTPKSLKNHS